MTTINKATRDKVLVKVSNDGMALKGANDVFKADREVVLAAVSNDGFALRFADDTLKIDREVVLAAVSNNGDVLEFVDDTFKADREVVLAAVSNYGCAIKYADDTLKIDREVVLAAVSNMGWALSYLDDTFKADREVVLAAVSNNEDVLEFVDDTLKVDPEVLRAAVSNNGETLNCADDKNTSECDNENVVYKFTPLEKKSIYISAEMYRRKDDNTVSWFNVEDHYRWGFGYISGKINDDLLPSKGASEVRCDSIDAAGFGVELNDQVGVNFEFSDDISKSEQKKIEAAYEEGGMKWIIEGDHNWEIESDAIVVLAPFKIDLYKDDETLIEENITLNT